MAAPSTTDTRLAFAILGALRVTNSDAEIDLGGRQQRAVLARLIVNGASGASLEQLANMLWGDRTPRGFVTTIHTYLFHLRKILEPDRRRGARAGVIVTEHRRYRLVLASEALDMTVFERAVEQGERLFSAGMSDVATTELERGLALWRGEVLADLSDYGFVSPLAARLNDRRLTALEALADCQLELGHAASAAASLVELIGQHPLHEQLHQRYMLSLYRLGRQSEALACYDELRRRLRDQLGIDPSPPLQLLHQQVLAHDRALDLQTPGAGAQLRGGITPFVHPPSPLTRTDAEVVVRLPGQRTSFVGREAELAEAHELLTRSRLLTLTGPGGTGKTRLAIKLAAEAAHDFPDGVTFVALAPVSDLGLVGSSIAHALELSYDGRRPVEDVLIEHLATKRALLVLDNFEHLISGVPLLTTLLDAAPRLRLVVTTRTRLRLSGEQQFPVPPLPLPPSRTVTASMAYAAPAVRLFVERAREINPAFALDDRNGGTVAAVCARLDGLPLAIELAAARTDVLTVAAINARLDRSLTLLSGGPRDQPDRLRSLHAAISWSYDLLTEPTQALFHRLSVFVGGASFDVIQKVCASPLADAAGGTDHVLDAITELVSQSLLRRADDGDTDEPRFTMLETIRLYATDGLSATRESDLFRQRHAMAFLELAEQFAPGLSGGAGNLPLHRLTLEEHNLRAAMAWFIERRRQAPAMRMATALWRYWQMRGQLVEAQKQIDDVLVMSRDFDGDRRLWLATIEAAGGIAYWRGDVLRAEQIYRDALDTSREIADPAWVARSLSNLAYALRGLDKTDEALLTAEEALVGFAELGDESGQAGALRLIAILRAAVGELDVAERAAADARALFEALNQPFDLAWTLRQVGMIELKKGNRREARRVLSEALRLFTTAQDASSVPVIVADLASVARAEGDIEKANALVQTSRSLQVASGAEWARVVDRLENRDRITDDYQNAT